MKMDSDYLHAIKYTNSMKFNKMYFKALFPNFTGSIEMRKTPCHN